MRGSLFEYTTYFVWFPRFSDEENKNISFLFEHMAFDVRFGIFY